MDKYYVQSKSVVPGTVKELAEEFLNRFSLLEVTAGGQPILIEDEKSGAFYFPCHLKATDFAQLADFNATIDSGEEDELYKLNREITENESAFADMVADANAGRSFEDIVVEFDRTYTPECPLKIYGGQHRLKSIQLALAVRPDTYHGLRVYFGLTKEQKVEIATINNTSIAVSNDLLDRMREQLLGSELRDYCQAVGLLEPGQDFADRRDFAVPTVRIARTLIVNFWRGRKANEQDFHAPIVCKSGGIDQDYLEARAHINWSDPDLLEMGRQFAKLNRIQREKVMGRKRDSFGEFARKALSHAVVAAWSYAVGYYTRDTEKRETLFTLPDTVGVDEDPLNAKALSEARLKGIDPDTYRGLGTRTNADELGRMLEVFFVLAEKATEKKISAKLANAAIQSYEAKKAANKAAKSLSGI